MAEIIIQGQRPGEINPSLDPKAVSVLFLGLVQPPVPLGLSNGEFEITSQAEKAWQIFSKAIQGEESRTGLRTKGIPKRPQNG